MHTDISRRHLNVRRYGQRGNCSRCSGFGYISCYRHIMDGICFQCLGSGNSKQLLHSVVVDSALLEPLKRRWFIGFLRNEKKLEQIFAFTADSLIEGNNRASRELSNIGLDRNNLDTNFELCIGEPGENKKTTLSKFERKNSVSLN